nr:MAG TPA: hypothetical protein [Bacteriophage sp.]
MFSICDIYEAENSYKALFYKENSVFLFRYSIFMSNFSLSFTFI